MQKEFYDHLRLKLSKYKTLKEIEELCFKAIIDSYARVKLINKIAEMNENRIRDQFVIDLENSNNKIRHALECCIIKIIPESYDAHTRKRSDIQFWLPFNERSLVFECKKLSSAESRYVTDGLARFVNLEYASGEKDAALLGFIVCRHFNRTVNRLKAKVLESHLISFRDETVFHYKPSFQSIHKRRNSSHILIYHLFFHFA